MGKKDKILRRKPDPKRILDDGVGLVIESNPLGQRLADIEPNERLKMTPDGVLLSSLGDEDIGDKVLDIIRTVALGLPSVANTYVERAVEKRIKMEIDELARDGKVIDIPSEIAGPVSGRKK